MISDDHKERLTIKHLHKLLYERTSSDGLTTMWKTSIINLVRVPSSLTLTEDMLKNIANIIARMPFKALFNKCEEGRIQVLALIRPKNVQSSDHIDQREASSFHHHRLHKQGKC